MRFEAFPYESGATERRRMTFDATSPDVRLALSAGEKEELGEVWGSACAELFEDWSQDLGHQVVGLTGQGVELCVGESAGDGAGGFPDRVGADLADDHQGFRADRSEQTGRAGEDQRVVGEGVGSRLERRPERGLSQLGDDLWRYADASGLVELDGVTATTGTDQRIYLAGHLGPVAGVRPRDLERRVIQRELGDGQASGGGAQGKDGPRGVSEDRGATAGGADKRLEIVDLAVDRVRQGVGAGAAATAVVVEHRQRVGVAETRRQWCSRGPVVEGSQDEDDGRAVAGTVVADRS